MTSQQYLYIRQLRASEAETHYDQMCDKYEVIIRQRLLQERAHEQVELRLAITEEFSGEVVCDTLNKAYDYTNWWDWRYCGETQYRYYDTPRPYSGEYFGYFMKTMMQAEFGKLKAWLFEEFCRHYRDKEYPDEIDIDYIEGLLDEAEMNWQMHIDGALLVIRGCLITGYAPEHSLTLMRVDGVATSDTLQSGENYRRRAARIRMWCNEWNSIDELHTRGLRINLNPTLVSESKNTSDISSSDLIQESNHYTPLLKKEPQDMLVPEPEKSALAGQPTGVRDKRSIDDCFVFGFRTEHCDQLAEKLDLCPPDKSFELVDNANTKIWILVSAIIGSDKEEAYSLKNARKLTEILGRRYGYTVSLKLSNKNTNKEYETSLPLIKDAIERMKNKGEFK